MNPENSLPKNEISRLLEQLNQESIMMSGNFEELETYWRIINYGEKALEHLFSEFQEPTWAHLEVIGMIANQIGKPIYYPLEILGRHKEVTKLTLDWARANRYIKEESGTN